MRSQSFGADYYIRIFLKQWPLFVGSLLLFTFIGVLYSVANPTTIKYTALFKIGSIAGENSLLENPYDIKTQFEKQYFIETLREYSTEKSIPINQLPVLRVAVSNNLLILSSRGRDAGLALEILNKAVGPVTKRHAQQISTLRMDLNGRIRVGEDLLKKAQAFEISTAQRMSILNASYITLIKRIDEQRGNLQRQSVPLYGGSLSLSEKMLFQNLITQSTILLIQLEDKKSTFERERQAIMDSIYASQREQAQLANAIADSKKDLNLIRGSAFVASPLITQASPGMIQLVLYFFTLGFIVATAVIVILESWRKNDDAREAS